MKNRKRLEGKSITKRIWINGNGIKITFPNIPDTKPLQGKHARLYGSSKVLTRQHDGKYFIETENIVLLDGVKIK